MPANVGVTLLSYGEGEQRLLLAPAEATVGHVVRRSGLSTQGRRVAVNGRKADGGTTVVEGDVVTLIPRVQ
ncbi:MAG: MoaD/ThiS family protein, partial [Acidobacteriota bacterium]